MEDQRNLSIIHPKGKNFGNQRNAYWISYPHPVSNPPKGGITYNELRNALDKFYPDDLQYLGGIQEINIWDRENEELWLKRCLTSEEDIDDWTIVYIAAELNDNGLPHGWFKQVLKNKKTNLYSLRSSSKWNSKDNYFKINNLKSRAKDNKWFVEWSKLLVDKKFWINLKNLLN